MNFELPFAEPGGFIPTRDSLSEAYAWVGGGQALVQSQLRDLEALRAGKTGLYMGLLKGEWVVGRPDAHLLVFGTTRSGKTSGTIIPNVLAWPGPVVSTSIKTDVLEATATERSARGRCWLFDPAGTTNLPTSADLGFARIDLPSVERLRWSPTEGCSEWVVAERIAKKMVRVSKTTSTLSGDGFFSERAASLLGTLLHAAAIDGMGIRQVSTWVRRRDMTSAENILLAGASDPGTQIAIEELQGFRATNERELNSHWSTANSTLSAYRSPKALAMAENVNFKPSDFPKSNDTIYITSSGSTQADVASIIVAFLEELREATYVANTERLPRALWVLDELANIAPIPDFPRVANQAAGQGILLLACLHDLSQARQLWEQEADGLLTLFREKVLYGGVSDGDTLERLSQLVGETNVEVKSTSISQGSYGGSQSEQISSRKQRRLPVSTLASANDGFAYAFHTSVAKQVVVFPYYRLSPWRELAAGPKYERRLKEEVQRLLEAGRRQIDAWLVEIATEAGVPGGCARQLLVAINHGWIGENGGDGSPQAQEHLKALIGAGLLEPMPGGRYLLSSLCVLLLSQKDPEATFSYLDEGAAIDFWLLRAALVRVVGNDWLRLDVTDQAARIVLNMRESERQKVGTPRHADVASEALYEQLGGDANAVPAAIEKLRAELRHAESKQKPNGRSGKGGLGKRRQSQPVSRWWGWLSLSVAGVWMLVFELGGGEHPTHSISARISAAVIAWLVLAAGIRLVILVVQLGLRLVGRRDTPAAPE